MLRGRCRRRQLEDGKGAGGQEGEVRGGHGQPIRRGRPFGVRSAEGQVSDHVAATGCEPSRDGVRRGWN